MHFRNAYMVRLSDGTYLAPRLGGRRFYKPVAASKKKTTFERARIFSTKKSAEMSAILIPNAKVIELYITESISLKEDVRIKEDA